MNYTTIIGNLTREPQEVKLDGKNLCKLNVAVKENYTIDGERPTQFFNVAVWGPLAVNCLRYLDKGSKVAVIGRLQTRTWEDNGTKKYAVEIVATEVEFLSNPPKKDDAQPKMEEVPDEDLPF